MFFDHEIHYIKKTNPVELGVEEKYVVLTTGDKEGKIKVKVIMTDSFQFGAENFLVRPKIINTESDQGFRFEWYAWEE